MNKKTKKGFTIVELVIVIAVIAILAAVLIPTFSNVIEKAKVSNDVALVKNINTVLAVEEAGNAKPATMTDALAMAQKGGYTVEKLTPRSTGEILWNSKTNRFMLVKGDEVVFGDKAGAADVDIWQIASELPLTPKYSIYAGPDWTGGSNRMVANRLMEGFDVGNNDIPQITYIGTDTAQSVVIRTNGGTLTVGSSAAVAKGQIWHYGSLDKAIIYTETSCFHTYGKISDMELEKGKVIAENNSYVSLTKVNAGTVIEENNKGIFVIPSTATTANVDATVANTIGYTVSATGTTANEERQNKISTTVYEISSKEELIAFRDAWNAGKLSSGMTFALANDIDMLGYEWVTPIGTNSNPFKGTFDGQNHSILNLSNNGKPSTEILVNNTTGNQGSIFGLFGYTGGVTTIQNLRISVNAYSNAANGWGAVVAAAKEDEMTLTLQNITATGILNGKDKAAGLVGDASGLRVTLSFIDCTNEANVSGDRAAGIVACVQNAASISFVNCRNKGEVTSTNTNYSIAAGISCQVPVGNSKNILTYSGITNEGNVTARIAYNYFTAVVTKFVDGVLTRQQGFDKATNFMELHDYSFVGGPCSEQSKMDWKKCEEILYSGSDTLVLKGLLFGIEYGNMADLKSEVIYASDGLSRKFDTMEAFSNQKYMHSGNTIRLHDDYTWETPMTQERSFVIDLNGHTLTANCAIHTNINAQTLKVMNGTIEYGSSYTGVLFHQGTSQGHTSTLVLENITLNASDKTIISMADGNIITNVSGNVQGNVVKYGSSSSQTIIFNGQEQTGGYQINVTAN